MPRSRRPERCPTWHKQAFLDRLISTAVDAGAPDPVGLGRQLAVVFEGAAALSASSNDTQVVPDARRAAETLIQVALTGPKPTSRRTRP